MRRGGQTLLQGVRGIDAPDTIDTFKNRLDKFWKNHSVVYDYKSDLTLSFTNIDESLTEYTYSNCCSLMGIKALCLSPYSV